MPHRLTILGTGTCQLEAGRATSAVLLELGELRVVYDFGRGIATRLAELNLRQDDLEHVVISHFHPDHLSDLVPYLHGASHSRIDPRGRDLTIHGPPGLESLLGRLFALFGPGSLVNEDRFRLHLRDVEGERLLIGGRDFSYRHLPPAGNRGLGFEHRGRLYALTGDSDLHDAEVEFLRGVELGIFDAGHLDDEQIVELAVRSQARRLVCSHLYRELDEEALNAGARKRGYEGRLLVGRDLMRFDL